MWCITETLKPAQRLPACTQFPTPPQLPLGSIDVAAENGKWQMATTLDPGTGSAPGPGPNKK